MATKKYYPIMLDIQQKNCLVVGGGGVGLRKVSSLLSYGANVSIISRELCAKLEELQVNWVSKEYSPEFLENKFLVIAATDDEKLNLQIYEDCAQRNILINVVDQPELCSFILPAVFEEGDLTVAVGTNGQSPNIAKLIRDDIKELILGTRGSKLALKQAEIVINELKKLNPDMRVRVKIYQTLGDKMPDIPLQEIQEDDVFTRELDNAILSGEIDIAVHSLKDVPAVLPEGLDLSIISEREDPRDVLVSRDKLKLSELPQGAIIGTSSARRTEQVKKLRPDLNFKPIRGNIDERIKKIEEGQYDATVLAAAGLNRLGLQDKITEYFELKDFPTSPGQGQLAIITKLEV